MKKVLMIASDAPPYGGSHMLRVVNLANALYMSGVEVVILTIEPSAGSPNIDISSENILNRNIKVLHAPHGILHRRYYSIEKKKVTIKKKVSILSKLINRLKRNILIPDAMIDWYFEVIAYEAKEQTILTHQPDMIISMSMPNTTHLIGYTLSRKYRVKHFIDYADPWVFEPGNPRRGIRKAIEYFLEKKVINNSCGIVVATQKTLDVYVKEYGIDNNKISLTLMGFNELDKNTVLIEELVDASDNIRFIYGGALDVFHRNPEPFIEAFSAISEKYSVKSLFYVDDTEYLNAIIQKYNEQAFKIATYLPFEEFMKTIYCCEVLVLFGNSLGLQIPGKLFNYISTGRHILYIKNFDGEDDVEKILLEYGNVSIVNNNAKEIFEVIVSIITDKQYKTIICGIAARLKKYTWAEQGNQFAARVLKELENDRP